MYCQNKGCVCLTANQNYQGVLSRDCFASDIVTGSISEVTITGLKPDTSYEVKLSAINGKGEGESSPAEFFKTEPVRKWRKQHTLQLSIESPSDLFDLCQHKHTALGPSVSE